jgi:hypothetical protein
MPAYIHRCTGTILIIFTIKKVATFEYDNDEALKKIQARKRHSLPAIYRKHDQDHKLGSTFYGSLQPLVSNLMKMMNEEIASSTDISYQELFNINKINQAVLEDKSLKEIARLYLEIIEPIYSIKSSRL